MNSMKAFLCLLCVFMILSTLTGCGTQITDKFTESEVTFQTEDSQLAGTLAVPRCEGTFPAVIILAGSGPFDRNGDIDTISSMDMALDSTYKDIAQALSKEGFVTLRYDKRGVGDSTGDGGDLPEPSLKDLKAAIAFLKEQPSVAPNRIALIGHSLGGLWALMEAADDPDITAVCLMATPAKSYSEVILEQIEWLIKSQGKNETVVAYYVAQQNAIYDQLRSGELDPSTMAAADRSSYKFLKAIMNVSGADYAKQIKCHALILQGDKDLFTVIPEESQLLKEAFTEGGNTNVKLVVFPNLDHMFRLTPDQPSTKLYYEDRGHISADVVETIVDWMKDTLH